MMIKIAATDSDACASAVLEYIWLDDPEEGLTGPASRLWRLGERVAREILSELNQKKDCSINELQMVVDKFVSARVTEKAAEEDRTRAIKKALAQKRPRK